MPSIPALSLTSDEKSVLSYLISQFEADNEQEIRIQGSPIRVGGYTALDVSNVFKVTQKKAQKLLDSLVEKGAARVAQTIEKRETRKKRATGGAHNFHCRDYVTVWYKVNYYRATW